jgi:hypothetical protein
MKTALARTSSSAKTAVLVRVAGDLTLEAPAGVTRLTLPRLESVGGALEIVGPDLTWIELPALIDVGTLRLDSPSALVRAAFPQLRRVHEALVVYASTYLESIELLALERIGRGGLRLVANDRLRSVMMPRLAMVEGDLVIAKNTFLPSIRFLSGLRRLGGAVRVEANPRLSQAEAIAWGTAIGKLGVVGEGANVRVEGNGI